MLNFSSIKHDSFCIINTFYYGFLFYRQWADYLDGFGNIFGNTWLGLNNIHRLVASDSDTELHIFLEAYDDTMKYAHYDEFYIEDSSDNFRLSVSG